VQKKIKRLEIVQPQISRVETAAGKREGGGGGPLGGKPDDRGPTVWFNKKTAGPDTWAHPWLPTYVRLSPRTKEKTPKKCRW